ncbi:MAG: hypothetical protein ACD_45C00715G0001, partial [uncultured bacterium]
HKNFIILSGDDETAADWMLHELAQGVISVTANIAPKTMQLLCEACFIGDAVTAQYMQQILLLLHQRLFVTSNPIPVKWALHKMGKIAEGIRLPLLPLETQHHKYIEEAMQAALSM